MNLADVDRVVTECALLDDAYPDPELRALRRAIFLEEALGITLTDEQFDLDPVRDRAALAVLLGLSSENADVRHLRPGQ